ncbi:MAG TPA: hypothetical protein VGM02_07440 [Acidobacteriaceae bacterium]
MTTARNILLFIITFCSCLSIAGASAARLGLDAEGVDPISGLHWQRLDDPEHPAAPPRLRLMRGSDATFSARKNVRRASICVRAGDHVSLRDTNPRFSNFSLEAIALQSGACGARVRARVAVTGGLVEMTILSSGVGILSGKASAWR